MLIRVVLPEGDFLADVGFGGVVQTAPLRLEPGLEQDTGEGVYRLLTAGDELQLEFRLPDRWAPVYQLSLAPAHAADYELANWYGATHPRSPFTSTLMAAWVGEHHRYALGDNRLSLHPHAGGATEKRVLNAAELETMLHETFGLSRPDDAAALAELYRRLSAS
jgi:N-hydroxyarylamine O-acetyltransferase